MLGEIHRIKIDRNSPTVSHITYIDDLLIMGRTKPSKALVIKNCFNTYCNWFGQKANFDKSSILFSKKMKLQEKKEVKKILGYRAMKKDSVYLDNTSFWEEIELKSFKS